MDISTPVPLLFIFETIGVIVAATLILAYVVRSLAKKRQG